MSLHAMINSKKTKYSVLNEKFKPYVDPECDNINFIIDINSVISSLYNPTTLDLYKSINVDEKFMISSELLNIAAHYRHYVYSRLRKYSTFYFFHSSGKNTEKLKTSPTFKEEYYGKYIDNINPTYKNINEIMSNNLRLSKIISEYIPHCYVIDTEDLDPSVVPYFVQLDTREYDKMQGTNSMNVIMTNNSDLYQTVTPLDNSIILTIKSDNSKVIQRHEIIDELVKKNKTKLDNKLIPDLYPIVMAISGYKRNNIDGLKLHGPMRSIKLLNDALEGRFISNIRYDDHDLLIKSLKEFGIDDVKIDIIERNLKLIDYRNDYNMLRLSDKSKIETQIVDANDPESLRFMNDYYYKRYPLNLEFLFEGE